MKSRKASKKVVAKKRHIVVCSSASFYKQVLEVRKLLVGAGFKVTIPLVAGIMEKSGDFRVETYKTWFKDPKTYNRKSFLFRDYFKKIKNGDVVLVLNYFKNGKPGYIGGAVLMEITIAFHYKKPIYILNKIDKSVSYMEEILGMQPIILNGILGGIK